MKRIVGLLAAGVLALGVMPWAATAGTGHVYQPIGDTGYAVGVESPASQGRTCVFVQTPEGWKAVGVGAGLYYQENTGTYDAHNETDDEYDGSMCGAEEGHE